jgi:L-gulonate 3-dehydrogenase
MLFASVGHHWTLYDVEKSQVEAALAGIQREMKELEECGNLKGSLSAEEQFKLVSAGSSLADALNGA